MWIQQVFVACFCILLTLQQTTAVVNNGQKTTSETTVTNNNSSSSSSVVNANNNNVTNSVSIAKNNEISSVTDSIAASSEVEPKRREAPLGLSDSYGVPLSVQNSYVPSAPSNIGLPVPVYGVPDAPTNNLVYPAPPPDIPPPIQAPLNTYGPPKDVYGPPLVSLPPIKYGPPSIPSRPFKPFNFPKPVYGPPPSFGPPPRPQYGPPLQKPLFIPPKLPKPSYGPPIKYTKPYYGPPKPLYTPSKPLNTYGPPTGYLNPPKDLYIPPKPLYGPPKGPAPSIQYGPPEPIPHGPPHPGVPAPPTPPDIKYDGWQPIPGLVSRPPSDSYGVPKGQPHGINDLQFNTDFLPPPSGGHGVGGGLGNYKGSSGLSDSYGAPLNTVTGSGGIISTSGDNHHNHGGGDASLAISSFGIGGSGGHGISGSGGHGGNALSVVKSIEYEILPNAGGLLGDSYTSPPLNSYSPNGPYAASHSYKLNDIALPTLDDTFASSLASAFDTTLLTNTQGFGQDLSSGIGLIPPSGVYGIPSSGQHGTPLLQPPGNKYGAPINQPKHPIVFREPVPPGLIESIGHSVAQKDAHGIIESAHSNNFAGPAYVPPPVPDVTKPVREEEPSGPSNLYSLPHRNPSSFQNYVQGSATAGLSQDFSSSFNFNGAQAAALTSYTAPLGTVDGSYGLPQNNVGLSGPHAAASDVSVLQTTNSFGSNGYSSPYFATFQGGSGHNCSQASQPLPPLSFGVPAANSYTASLSSLNTNIAGAYQGPAPALNYGAPDLQAAHSQATGSLGVTNNLDEEIAQSSGKSLANNFGPGSELIKSQSIDLNNIPLQGALGSYTLQIQSADGGIGAPSAIRHDQVLNDGLLQSILNAIEQPQQNTAAILGQPLLHLQQVPPQTQPIGIQQIIPPSAGGDQLYADSEAQNSLTKNVVVTPPPLQTSTGRLEGAQDVVTEQSEDNKGENLQLIDNNEIALYFSNAQATAVAENRKESDTGNNDQTKGGGENVRNGQQYGSYVTFKTPGSGYVYGDLKTSNSTSIDEGTKTKTKT